MWREPGGLPKNQNHADYRKIKTMRGAEQTGQLQGVVICAGGALPNLELDQANREARARCHNYRITLLIVDAVLVIERAFPA